jgi:hypothetical protein
MGTFKAKRQDTKRAERTFAVCMRADLVADWESADAELKRANDTGGNSMEGNGVGELVDRVRDLEAQMLEHTDTFRLRAISRYAFRQLADAHPPRLLDNGEPHTEDAITGVNRDTFFHALIKASTAAPELDDEDWAWLLGHTDSEREQLIDQGREDEVQDGVLTHRQFGDLSDAAWFLNRGEVKVPFSHAASLATRNSGDE